ncbi:MAG: hypothetical protein U0835_05785 [Isosphaeraceae bacterium]
MKPPSLTIGRLMLAVAAVAALLVLAREAPWVFYGAFAAVVFLFPFWGALLMTRLPVRQGRQVLLLGVAGVLIAAAAVYRIEAETACLTDTFAILVLGGLWLVLPCAVGLMVGSEPRRNGSPVDRSEDSADGPSNQF